MLIFFSVLPWFFKSSHLSCQKTLMYLFQSGGLAKRLVGKFSVELAPRRLSRLLRQAHGTVVVDVTLAPLCYAGFLSFVLLEDNRILKQDEKDHLSCLADSKPLFVVASSTIVSTRNSENRPTRAMLFTHSLNL